VAYVIIAAMPIILSGQSDTTLLFSVAPTTTADQGNLTLTWPNALPAPMGLLQSDSNGVMRWVSASGLPPGESRNYTGSFQGTCQDASTPCVLARASGGGSAVVVPQPASSPSGLYIEAVVRAYDPSSPTTIPTFVRVFTGGLYNTDASYSASGNVSYHGDVSVDLTDISITLAAAPDGSGDGNLGITVTGPAGLKVSADLAAYGEPSSST